ncbi:GDSL-type esterase/lipase family protein [Microbispora sp. NBC_01189]|uniref:GDSL-type esterase/lipase family protein n=1 Tax=Microbispora sp. NBC_01189 TaxID=2903583 RepID=UPI002E153FE9|nr:GDSL-type esterase/lipase family protein [Microbispora sp. NBC_01189]
MRSGWMTGRVAVATTLVLALVLGLCPPPVAASASAGSAERLGNYRVAVDEPSGDVTIELEAGGFSSAVMTQLLTETQGRNARLSDTIKADVEANPNGMGGDSVEQWADFDGRLTRTPTGIGVVIAGGVPLTNATFWEGVVAGAVGLLTGIAVRALCLGFMPEAAVFCAVAGAFTGTMVRGMIVQAFDHTLRDPKEWANTMVSAILAGAGAGAWECCVKVWAKDKLPGYITMAGNGIRKMVDKFWSGWAALREAVSVAVDFMIEIAKEIPGAVSRIRIPMMMRVMPLGDSITLGVGSPTSSSYRISLQRSLGYQGLGYDFVGSQASGGNPPGSPGGGGPAIDLDHEGHSGWRVDQIQASAQGWLQVYRPDVVLLHLGTNDMIQDYLATTAVDRLMSLTDLVFTVRPQATVIVSTLVPSRTPAIDARIRQFNQRLPGLVRGRVSAGRHLVLVDMSSVTKADIADDVHPNDNGYTKMAKVFNLGILNGVNAGWITGSPPGAGSPTCVPGPDGSGSGRRVARFADLNGDGRDDYLAVDPRNGNVRAWLNRGADSSGDHWQDVGVIASGTNTGVGPFGRRIQFADLNGDGRDDYLAVDPANGSVLGWLNAGAEAGGDRWTARGAIASGYNTGVGNGARQTWFADLNGDACGDYLAVDPASGNVHGWLNVRADFQGDNWLDRGVIASGYNTGVGL